MYHEIDETGARRAKEMNSYSDYKAGSATAEYRAQVDEAKQLAERQKARVDPMYHERIDYLLGLYARKLAENYNHGFAIEQRCPSVLVAGPANFPVRKKEKQNRAREKNMEDYRYIQGLLHKIKATGTGGISSADPNALTKLEIKLEGLLEDQEHMKAVNTYYRKHKKLEGCPGLSEDARRKIEASMDRHNRAPYPTWALSNNNAVIHNTRDRIKELEALATVEVDDLHFEGGYMADNPDAGRVQFFFDEKPPEEIRKILKRHAFNFAPSWDGKPWQRIRTANALRAGKEAVQEIKSAQAGGHQSRA